VLVGLSVASLALAQTPRGSQAWEAEDVLEAENALATATVLATETLQVPEDTLRPQAIAKTGFFSVYRDPTIAGHYCFSMWDVISMSQYDAQGYLNNGAKLRLSMWGDDGGLTGDDDLLIGPLVVAPNGNASPYFVGFYASTGFTEGIYISWAGCVPSRVLNEDVGGDELYVSAIVVAGDGSIIRKLETPRVYGNY
jgi:hypothetical protein